MIVGTTEAAKILNISTARLRILTHKVKYNQKHSSKEPVIIVKQRGESQYGHEVFIVTNFVDKYIKQN